MRNHFTKVILIGASLAIGGCSFTKGPEDSWLGGNRVNKTAAAQIFPSSTFEALDLAVLLGEPSITTGDAAKYKCEEGDKPGTNGCINARGRLDKAFQNFSDNYPGLKGLRERNEIQDRLIAASEQRCNVYKIYLKRSESKFNFWSGSLATALGGAGAIVTGEAAARTLAGLSGITSGVRAEYNQAYLANLGGQVIAAGIDVRRKELKKEIEGKRGYDLTNYTVQAAVADAISYHGACSVIEGMKQAGEAVQQFDNPGISMMTKVFYQQRHLQEVLDVDNPSDLKWGELAKSAASSKNAIKIAAALPYATPLSVEQLFLDGMDIQGGIIKAIERALKERPNALEKDGNNAIATALKALLKDAKEGTTLKRIQTKYSSYVSGTVQTKAKANALSKAKIEAKWVPGKSYSLESLKELARIENESRELQGRYEIIEVFIGRIVGTINKGGKESINAIGKPNGLYADLEKAIP